MSCIYVSGFCFSCWGCDGSAEGETFIVGSILEGSVSGMLAFQGFGFGVLVL